MTTRILLRGGLIADGIGATIRRADLLIEGETIASIRDVAVTDAAEHAERTYHEPPADCEVIDLAPGSVVCPGFIDAHAHAEGPMLASGRVDGALAQGVTTLLVGQDGQSWIGASASTASYLNRYFGPVNGTVPISLSDSGSLNDSGPLSNSGPGTSNAVSTPEFWPATRPISRTYFSGSRRGLPPRRPRAGLRRRRRPRIGAGPSRSRQRSTGWPLPHHSRSASPRQPRAPPRGSRSAPYALRWQSLPQAAARTGPSA